MSIEAMKQALEALESATPKYTRQRADQKTLGGALDYWKLEQHQRLKAITFLRQAIAEAEKQKPVGEAYLCEKCHTPFDGAWECPSCGHNTSTKEAVYTHPQSKREWVGLTDEDIDDLVKNTRWYELIKATEAKLKEKNT